MVVYLFDRYKSLYRCLILCRALLKEVLHSKLPQLFTLTCIHLYAHIEAVATQAVLRFASLGNTVRPSLIVRGLITSTGVVLVVVLVVLGVASLVLVAFVACHYFYYHKKTTPRTTKTTTRTTPLLITRAPYDY